MKFHIVQLPPFSHHLIPLRSKYNIISYTGFTKNKYNAVEVRYNNEGSDCVVTMDTCFWQIKH
jgi:hypothetical protein